MTTLIQFFAAHWQLTTGFIVLLIALMLLEVRHHIMGIAKLSPQQVTQLLNKETGVVVDIRDKAHFAKGHILSAISLPLTELAKAKSKLAAHSTKTMVIVCANGQQSLKAALQLKQQGFSDVKCLAGGMNAWRAEQLPVTK